ncbi:hypothetical protein GCM10027598_63800 [Amycolatopsis oliviviridis]|uniref:Uncharacterized protein n=1 Tax=Amycolatopsis oliviviridis TaxID=1471590 RepID=A0ABQ3M4G0_9PSEU|nr:hypothetical protein [Amycolatopsis oliviviridis]GHH33455.1 hypothetical protein GCM10017790_72100 [Amycolatopsis oliviviridis]
MALEPAFSADVFRAAASRQDVPPRLARAADAVLEGKFTWEDVAAGTCEHPLALALFTPKAKKTLWPALTAVETELATAEPGEEPAPPPPPPRARRAPVADDDFSDVTYLEDLAEPPSHPGWPRRL